MFLCQLINVKPLNETDTSHLRCRLLCVHTGVRVCARVCVPLLVLEEVHKKLTLPLQRGFWIIC